MSNKHLEASNLRGWPGLLSLRYVHIYIYLSLSLSLSLALSFAGHPHLFEWSLPNYFGGLDLEKPWAPCPAPVLGVGLSSELATPVIIICASLLQDNHTVAIRLLAVHRIRQANREALPFQPSFLPSLGVSRRYWRDNL